MKIDKAKALIKEYKKDDGQLPATLYVPKDDYGELHDDYTENNPFFDNMEIKGIPFSIDVWIKDPIILPNDQGELPEFLEDPPEEKIQELIDVEMISYEDHLRHMERRQYVSRVFLKPFCKWQRFDEEMVEKYGDPFTTQSLSIRKGEDREYTHTDFDYAERQKFAFEQGITPEVREADIDDLFNGENAERRLIEGIHDALWSVQTHPVYAVRERTLKGPYPILDIEHREELRFGERYTTYESLFMRKIDTTAQKYQLEP